MRLRFTTALAGLLLATLAAGCGGSGDPGAAGPATRGPYPIDRAVRVNQIQVIGTHNSYHLRGSTAFLGASVDYAHAPLAVQLGEQGVRSFELDVYNRSDLPVEHAPVVDSATNCTPLEVCLRQIEQWSDANPGHVPIFVLVEPKDPTFPLNVSYDGWDRAALDRLDRVVRTTIGDDDLLTPDDVRGGASTLRVAVTGRGWPTLRRTRGQVAVVLSRGGALRDAYLDGRPSLEGAAMFVTADPDAPSAAVVKRDRPNPKDIEALVREGFVVRTRADADLVEARAGDAARATRALASGAQVVSTDFPVPDPKISSSYVTRLPKGGAARCNPVNAPRRCRARFLENAPGLHSPR